MALVNKRRSTACRSEAIYRQPGKVTSFPKRIIRFPNAQWVQALASLLFVAIAIHTAYFSKFSKAVEGALISENLGLRRVHSQLSQELEEMHREIEEADNRRLEASKAVTELQRTELTLKKRVADTEAQFRVKLAEQFLEFLPYKMLNNQVPVLVSLDIIGIEIGANETYAFPDKTQLDFSVYEETRSFIGLIEKNFGKSDVVGAVGEVRRRFQENCPDLATFARMTDSISWPAQVASGIEKRAQQFSEIRDQYYMIQFSCFAA